LYDTSLLIEEVAKNSAKVILIGNGGSSAIASHLSIDLTKSASVRAINFNEGSLLTCFSNDYGYDHWVEMALEFYADKDDLIILISSSGQSKNIINAAKKAKAMSLSVVTLSGFSTENPLRSMGDINIWVDSSQYNIIESVHQICLLSVVDYLVENKRS
jgi:D-sedoheptulose 7-phosphate isomerase